MDTLLSFNTLVLTFPCQLFLVLFPFVICDMYPYDCYVFVNNKIVFVKKNPEPIGYIYYWFCFSGEP